MVDPRTEEPIPCPDGSQLKQSRSEAFAPIEQALARGADSPEQMPDVAAPTCPDGSTPDQYFDMVEADKHGGLDNDMDAAPGTKSK